MKKSAILFAMGLLCAGLTAAAPLFPYILGNAIEGDLATVEAEVRTVLEAAGFEVVGGYSPYDGAMVVVVTHPEQLKVAAGSEMGGFGAAIRVGMTRNGDNIEISYNTPAWVAGIMRLENDLAPVSRALDGALGNTLTFGSKKGKEYAKLKKYHYMAFMPYFDDAVEVASHDSHQAAVEAVEAGLAAGKGGTAKVYRVDIPGKDEVLFGVALAEGEGADATVMETTDTGEPKHTAHLPYDLLVSGSNVYTLHGKFRIAQSFPDLGMGTFMKISGAPKAIHEAMEAAAN